MKFYLALAAALALTACGGGSDSLATAGGSDTTARKAAVLTLTESSNIASAGFPWNGVLPGVSKRWALPIPVKTNGEVRAAVAMDAIEAKLGVTVFDRTSIANANVSTITRGIVFSQGTSFLPVGANPQSYCANVSNGPNLGGYPSGFVAAPGTISTRLYVNLDNPSCTASADITIHELGHALGLGTHFAGFGDGPPISSDFWSVMKTLYANPAGTAKASINVVLD